MPPELGLALSERLLRSGDPSNHTIAVMWAMVGLAAYPGSPAGRRFVAQELMTDAFHKTEIEDCADFFGVELPDRQEPG